MCGTTFHGLHFILVADGHGNNKVLKSLKKIEWEKVLDDSLENIKEYIFQSIGEKTTGSGSTLSIVIYKEDSEDLNVLWIGDSTIKIFENSTLIEETEMYEHKDIKPREITEIKNIQPLEIYTEEKRKEGPVGVISLSKTAFRYLVSDDNYILWVALWSHVHYN